MIATRWTTRVPLLLLVLAGAAPVARAQQEPRVNDTVATTATYIGNDRCASCHRPEHAAFNATEKGRRLLQHPRSALEQRGCESCHGPASEHAEVEGKVPVKGFITFARDDPTPVRERNAVCLRCHEGGARMFWQASQHDARDVACSDCHSMMKPQSETAMLRRPTALETCGACHRTQANQQRASFTRMPVHENKMGCGNCHNPHGSGSEKLLLASSVNETCVSCHAEKRGPFLWEHAPVAENCANCHNPHGGNNEMMLTRAKPRLCQQCHVESRHPTDPQRLSSTRTLMSRQCLNCHTQIHGSNHPSGIRFVR
jgi:DmsE family decaheme c-type cytochrome